MVDDIHRKRNIQQIAGLAGMKKQLLELVKKNELPVSCEHLINLALLEKQQKRDREGLKLDSLESYFTAQDHVNELHKIIKRFNMDPNLMDKERDYVEKEVMKQFVTNADNPYFDFKQSGGVSRTL